jgi:hypothetical protein
MLLQKENTTQAEDATSNISIIQVIFDEQIFSRSDFS